MAIDLFDNSSDDDEEISKIEINEDFARRYEHNKKREDLHRLEEMKKKGLIGNSSSESESESSYDDDSDDMNSKRKEIEFFDALLKVRKKDPILKEKDAKLFASDSSEDEERIRSEGRGRKREKEKMAKYLKDVTAQHLLEEGPEFEEVKEDVKKVKSYAEEQEDLRQAFLDAVAEAEIDDGDGGEFLREKAKENKEEEEEKNEEVKKRLDEYFGEDDKLDEKEMFLKDFFKNKMWIDTDKGKEMMEEDVVDFSDEEEELEKQEDYERGYNFRFEENAGDRVLGHSRSVQGSVRKKENARKRQRQSKEERIALAELERKEEVKRLKNVMKKEIAEKLNRIREVAGLDQDRVIPLTADDLEEEFDPDDYDKTMKAAFGEDYYEADDADPEFGSDRDDHGSNLHKPNFDEEDELLGLPKGWDVLKPGDGFSAEREKYLKSKVKNEANEEAEAGKGGWEDEEQSKEGRRKRKQKLSLKEKVALEKDLDELYKLDYEDTIGDLKTRFKYQTVRTRRYGLNAAELLTMDDKDLNQYVSLKKLAPYSEKEWKVPRIKRYQMLLQAKMAEQINRKKQRKTYEGSIHAKETGTVEDGKAQDKQPSDNSGGGMSRRAKRRCRQAELKISKSRLIAYGKLPTTSKRKSKR